MTYKDLILTPIFLILYLLLLLAIRKRYTTADTARYFIPAFLIKCIGAVALGLIYQFYYGGGDTLNYYSDSKVIYTALTEDFISGLDLLFRAVDPDSMLNYKYRSQLIFYRDPHSYFISRLAAVISLFCANTYSVIAITFALFSFWGNWAMYNIFVKLYPKLHRAFAIAILFLPSVVFWGSGIMKDSITFGALGLIFHAFYTLFIEKKFNLGSIFTLLFGTYLIYSIKIYILICFLPTLMIWAFLNYTDLVQNRFYSLVIKPLFIIIAMGGSMLLVNKITEEDARYNMENISDTAAETAYWISHVSETEGGSTYTLSQKFDGSAGSILRIAPEAFAVTYFRPFLWEIRNPVMALSGLESFGILVYFLYSLYFFVTKTPSILINPPRIVFVLLIFCVIFGIAVGMTTLNFGSLVRYKIPSLSFFVAALVIWKYESTQRLKS